VKLHRYLLFVLFLTFSAYTQPGIVHEYGKPSQSEIEMQFYEKDSTAQAVVLYELGDYSFVVIRDKIYLLKKVYRKIKILSDDAKDFATVSIILHGTQKNHEWINGLKAVTRNGYESTHLSNDDVFYKPYSGNRIEATFAFPNVRKGSVLEYQYNHLSPFFFNLDGWTFQNNIPTVYSEFKAEIPGIFIYNRSLIGGRKLSVNSATIKTNCFSPVPGYSASCEVLNYAMEDIPPFVEEDYMLSPLNYISRLDFQLEQFTAQSGKVIPFTKSWFTVDEEFRKDKNIGAQTRRNNFLRRQLPRSINTIQEPLERAKAVFTFIQNHFDWNERNGLFFDANVRKAFNEKRGTASEINLALINALQAAGFESEIALLSTRDNGLPIKRHAIMTDFNYLIAFVKINGENYFLDATNKKAPFGILPFKCLNYDVRVMDFNNGSYWEVIKPYNYNINFVNVQLKADEDFGFSGKLRETNMGYSALNKRKELKDVNRSEYLRSIESEYGHLEITSYSVTDQHNIDKPIVEDFDIHLELNQEETLIFNPFLFKEFKQNPFQLEERKYPVDFGHPMKYTYNFSLDVSGKYKLVELPKNQTFKMPDDMGETSVVYSESNGVIQVRFHMYVNEHHFESESYEGLKTFFNLVVQIQNNSPLLLKKI
jgi:hypothetical protein